MAKYNYFPYDLSGDIFWAKFDAPDDNGRYTFELGNLSDAAIDMLKERGIEIRNKPEQAFKGDYVTLKSKFPFILDYAEGIEPSGESTKIGNGSKAEISVASYTHQHGLGLTVLGSTVRIKEIVEYDPDKPSVPSEPFVSDKQAI